MNWCRVREILWNSLYNIQMGPSFDNCQEEIMSCVNNYHRCKRGLSMVQFINQSCALTHWGRVPHICVGKLIIIGSDNGLPPDRRRAIIWTHAGLLSIEPLRTYFSENLIKIQQFSLKKIQVKMSSGKWRQFCLGLNVLIHWSNRTAANHNIMQFSKYVLI